MSIERVVRKIGYTIIALFVLLFFLPFVGLSLYDAIRANPRALLEFLREPGCWLIVLGPILLWASLAAFYFRIPKLVRSRSVGTLGMRYNVGAIVTLFRDYRRARGFDWLLWVMVGSGVVTVALIAVLLSSRA
jgi:hypothetical protein